MKKVILFSIGLIFLPMSVFAISGACSGHGGVDCIAPWPTNCKVLCKDGWVNSSVDYYDTDECKPYFGCISQNDLGGVKSKVSRNGLLDSPMGDAQIINCERQIEQYNKCENASYSIPVPTYAPPPPSDDYISSRIDEITNKAAEAEKARIEAEYWNKMAGCRQTYGDNSIYNQSTKRCECENGYAPNSEKPFKCVPLSVWCILEVGNNATNKVDVYIDGIPIPKTCKCKDGFELKEVSGKFSCLPTLPKLSINDKPLDLSAFEEKPVETDKIDPTKLLPKKENAPIKTENKLPNLTKLSKEGGEKEPTILDKQAEGDKIQAPPEDKKEDRAKAKPVSFFAKAANNISSFIVKFFSFFKR